MVEQVQGDKEAWSELQKTPQHLTSVGRTVLRGHNQLSKVFHSLNIGAVPLSHSTKRRNKSLTLRGKLEIRLTKKEKKKQCVCGLQFFFHPQYKRIIIITQIVHEL